MWVAFYITVCRRAQPKYSVARSLSSESEVEKLVISCRLVLCGTFLAYTGNDTKRGMALLYMTYSVYDVPMVKLFSGEHGIFEAVTATDSYIARGEKESIRWTRTF